MFIAGAVNRCSGRYETYSPQEVVLLRGAFFVALGLVNYLMFGLSFFIVIESRSSAFFGHEIGSAHTQQHDHATTQGGIRVTF